ncbi:hypothetical protein G6F61_014022 [Rhizopus arrhizus]|nr:hypothetical protein G6F31_020446 [Rhizopus arrhizus]KAG1362949.1 hypothetical protein G6F61_014022 [Rhizopus arrhizus]
MIAVNLTGTFHCIQAALPGMLQEKWGRRLLRRQARRDRPDPVAGAGNGAEGRHRECGVPRLHRNRHRAWRGDQYCGQDRHDAGSRPGQAGRAQPAGPPGAA